MRGTRDFTPVRRRKARAIHDRLPPQLPEMPMSDVLFLASPSHGHVNPTLGLVDALVRRGERVTYFASEPFRERVEATGAAFKAYALFLGSRTCGKRSLTASRISPRCRPAPRSCSRPTA